MRCTECFMNLNSGLESLSVGELKSLLSERGIDFRDCLEKRELVGLHDRGQARTIGDAQSSDHGRVPSSSRDHEWRAGSWIASTSCS